MPAHGHFGSTRSVVTAASVAVVAGVLAVGVLMATSQTGSRAATSVSACTPTVMMMSDAENGGGSPAMQNELSPSGKQHAQLYPSMISHYLAEPHELMSSDSAVTVCPVGKIIAVDPASGSGSNAAPIPNPYNTVRPLAESLHLSIEVKDPQGVSYNSEYEWTLERRLTLLVGGQSATMSTVVAWDRAGLNVSLLRVLPAVVTFDSKGVVYSPQPTHFFVMTGQDATTGKFAALAAYHQEFTTDGSTWYTKDALDLADSPVGIRVGSEL